MKARSTASTSGRTQHEQHRPILDASKSTTRMLNGISCLQASTTHRTDPVTTPLISTIYGPEVGM